MTAISRKAEGSSPAKKIVKRVISKGGTCPVSNKFVLGSAEQIPIPKKNVDSTSTVNQGKPVVPKLGETDNCVESKTDELNVQVDFKFEQTTHEEVKKVGIGAKATELRRTEDKPKSKKVVVKKKVIVVKKGLASAISSISEPASTHNYVTMGEKDIGSTVGHIPSTGMPPENSGGKEAKANIVTSEKPKKVITKLIVRKKCSAAPKEEIIQNGETYIVKKDEEQPPSQNVGAVSTDTRKSSTKEALLQIKDLNEVEADGLDEFEASIPAAEVLRSDDRHDVKEKQENAVEEPGVSAAIPSTKPFSERQKRKKLEVFIGGLDNDATEDDLRVAFQPVGSVVEVRLMMNPVTRKNKGYAFVRFASPEQALLAATEYSTMQIRGKKCGVLPNQDNDTLFIGNISRDWKSSEVLQKLEEYGVNGIEELTLIGDSQNAALNRGYAFLELATHHDALNAFQRLQRPGVTFGYDRPAKVAWAQPLAEADASTMSQVKSVFVDGLPPNWTEDMVKQNFRKFGEIERILLARNMPSAKRKNFAFVYFLSRESALACTQAFSNTELTDGDSKVKVKVSLTRPLQKGKVYKTFRYSGHPGHVRGHAGRGKGWFSNHSGRQGASHGFVQRGSGRRLYDEDEVRMLLKAAKDQVGWPSRTEKGRRFGQAPIGMTRVGYAQTDESDYYDAEQAESFRQQHEGIYPNDPYSRPSNIEATRGNNTKPISIRDINEPCYLGASRGSISQLQDHYVSPHCDSAYHHTYEISPAHGGNKGEFASGTQDYHDMTVGMKRPASAWDEACYHPNHRGYPRARVDSSNNPEGALHYASHTRSSAELVTQTLGMRQGRSTREGPASLLYESESGLGESGSMYNDGSYGSIPPETSAFPLGVSERRELLVYPPALYGGHKTSAGYDLHPPGY